MRRQHLTKGDVIFSEGDPSAYAYILESGEVEIYRGAGGSRIALARLGAGEIFGEMGLVDERPRSAGALVAEDAVVLAVTAAEFVPLLFEDPENGLRYLKALFDRLRDMNDRVSSEPVRPSQVKQETRVGTARIFGDSERTASMVAEAGLAIVKLPFRVGRTSVGVLGENHLECDDRKPYSLSRNHFLITRSSDGFVVRDRGSFLGTIVNGEKIGGRRHNGEAPLRSGDNLVIAGEGDSPFRFRVYVPE